MEGYDYSWWACWDLMQALHGPKGFLSSDRLKKFSTHRNDPNQPDALSGLSPYYHFGHLAAQRAALEASKLRSKCKVRQSHCWTCFAKSAIHSRGK